MKKSVLTFFVISLIFSASMKAFAFVNYEDKHPKKVTEVHMTGYINYAPFGWVDSPDKQIYGNFHTLFKPMIDDLIVSANLKMKYDLHQPTVEK
ncbi:MAG: hypothetical protein MJ210_04290 [Alphaproteobacteria bacterium]|nr:hypothetical protein [Alphaproteobacteria bacterium]